jgi:hypothetical protein
LGRQIRQIQMATNGGANQGIKIAKGKYGGKIHPPK